MKKQKKCRQLLAVLLALLCLLAGCNDDSNPINLSSDHVKVSDAYFGLGYYPEKPLNPVTTEIAVNRLLCEAMYEGLFQVSSNFTAQNVLCEEYKGDGSEFFFTLADDIQFWSGAYLDADDVVASLQAVKEEEDSPYHDRLTDVASIEAVTDRQIRVTLDSPNVNFPRLLDIPIYRVSAKDVGDMENEDSEDEDTDSEDSENAEDVKKEESFVEGTGPFQPVKRGNDWVLEANPYWHNGYLGSIREIKLVALSKPDAASASFQTGDISLLRTSRIAPEGVGAQFGGSSDTVSVSSASLHYLGINYQNSQLANEKVRQALSVALARQSICETQLQSFADPAVLPVNPQPDGMVTEENYTADTARAVQLLRESEITDTISIRLLVNENNSFKVAAAEQIASLWNALDGVKVTVEKEPYETFLSLLRSGSFDIYYGQTQLTPDFDLRPLLSSDGSLNFGQYNSEETEDTIASARQGEDVSSLYQRLLAEMPVIPLAFERGQIMIRKGLIHQYTPTPYNAFAGVEKWTSD